MQFLLQKEREKDKEYIDLDVRILKENIEHNHGIHSYQLISLQDLKERNTDDGYIPVGSIQFVQTWLNKYYSVTNMEPIEIPCCLQKELFLHRSYDFVEGKKLPKHGKYFVKRVDRLKELTFSGDISQIRQFSQIDKNGVYLISNIVEFISEWRIFIYNWKIVQCINYDGDPMIFPDKNLINEALITLMRDAKHQYPEAFTIDVGVLLNNRTALIEIHPWCSVGLYGYLFGQELPYCYADGIQWYINYNTPRLYIKKEDI